MTTRDVPPSLVPAWVVAWAFVLLLAWAAFGAPAPIAPPKAPAQPSPVGEWVLEWRGGSGPCRFAADGSFACFWGGKQWLGLWEMRDTPEGRVLAVSEWIPAQDELTPASQHLRWAARLKPGTLEGPLDDGGEFRLRKGKP